MLLVCMWGKSLYMGRQSVERGIQEEKRCSCQFLFSLLCSLFSPQVSQTESGQTKKYTQNTACNYRWADLQVCSNS